MIKVLNAPADWPVGVAAARARASGETHIHSTHTDMHMTDTKERERERRIYPSLYVSLLAGWMRSSSGTRPYNTTQPTPITFRRQSHLNADDVVTLDAPAKDAKQTHAAKRSYSPDGDEDDCQPVADLLVEDDVEEEGPRRRQRWGR